MGTLSFTKMQGLGNDFIVLDDLEFPPATSGQISSRLAQKLCDRRFGIGADQILWLKKAQSSENDFRMEILNADGSQAEMCGNGIRAVALYRHSSQKKQSQEYRIETLGGVKLARVQGSLVSVDMGIPSLGKGFENQGEEIEVLGKKLRFYEVDVGNPHAVIFVDQVESFPVEQFGPEIEKHPRFPERTNVEFVELINPHSIRVRVWERGAGITLACGTGACAAVVASLQTKKTLNPVQVSLPGGELQIQWRGEKSSIMMEGPALEVFRGQLSILESGLI
jgi:diaminopimelate epimerase